MNNDFFSDMKMKLDAIALIRENDDVDATVADAVDTVTLDVPLLLRMLEYAKEDAKTDLDLHDVTERMIELAKSGTLSMEHYNNIVQQSQSMEESQLMTESQFDEAAGEKDACYHKVKSRYKVWPSAYASGALTRCRKVGAANWGNKSKK
jgi:hypothetical protein